MNDEYGVMNAKGLTWNLSKLKLENGEELLDVSVVYQTFGHLNENCDNAVVVCHALTGNASIKEWWNGIFEVFDIQKDFLICSNILGSCYGTTGPSSINIKTGRRYGSTFPKLTVRDSVNLQIKLVRDGLGVKLVNVFLYNYCSKLLIFKLMTG